MLGRLGNSIRWRLREPQATSFRYSLNSMSLNVITYHFVHDFHETSLEFFRRTIKEFRQQLDYFQNTGVIIHPEQLFDQATKREEISHYLLTFDDGLREHSLVVSELLAERGASGVFFVPSGSFVPGLILDVQKVQVLLAHMGAENFLAFAKNSLGKDFSLYLGNKIAESSRIEARYEIRAAKTYLQRDMPADRGEVLDWMFCKVISKELQALLNESLYLSIPEARSLVKSGMMIGNHSATHPWLGAMERETAIDEVIHAQMFLESEGLIPSNCRTIAYPHGSYSEPLIDSLSQNEFVLGFTTNPGIVTVEDLANNPLTLSRFDTNDFPH